MSEKDLGLKKYMQASFKISQVDCPLLSNFLFEPFLFANFAIIDNVKSLIDQVQGSWRDKLKCSFGFGVSCQLPEFALEFYYSMLTKSGKKEQKSTIQINIGID